MLFRHNDERQIKLRVDLSDLQNEKERLSSFLQSKLKVIISPSRKKLTVKSEKLSVKKLHHVVSKFIYRRNLNNTHWVSIEGTTVKINRFKNKSKKKKKQKENTSPHQTAIQSWGL